MSDAHSAEKDALKNGLALGVERILDDSEQPFTTDELVETRDNLLALFYSHLDDIRSVIPPGKSDQ